MVFAAMAGSSRKPCRRRRKENAGTVQDCYTGRDSGGAPAYGLSEAAERLDADLMVIGRTHVASDVAKLGSNAYAIIAHSPCPVLSV
jgi:hypothetical protein